MNSAGCCMYCGVCWGMHRRFRNTLAPIPPLQTSKRFLVSVSSRFFTMPPTKAVLANLAKGRAAKAEK